MSNSTSSMRTPMEFVEFVERASTNRVKADIDTRTRSKAEIQRLLVKYFKENNDRYLEFIKMEDKNV